MNGRDARCLVAAAFVLVLLALPTSASAGVTFGQLGLTYTGTTTNWPAFPGRHSQTTYEPCEEAGRLASIGAWVSESVPSAPNYSDFAVGKAFNVSIRPFELVPGAPTPDSTKMIAENRFAADPTNFTMGESTVCTEDAQGLRYPSVVKPSAKRARTTAKVACPDDRHVLSGGALASGPFRSQRMVASAPYDSGDAGNKPDDGWKASVDNLRRKRRKMKVYAICTSSEGLSYVSTPFTAMAAARSHVEPPCADEFVIGGGVTHGIAYRKATLVASRVPTPWPTTMKWVIEVDNLSQSAAQGRAFAICHA
jgi:hypothetical protein